jgi:thioredoxin-like negative regulator of GroEL
MGKILGLVVVLALGAGIWYFVAGPGSQGAAPTTAGGTVVENAAAGQAKPAHDLPAVFTHQSFDEALAENKTSGKPLVVNFSASWCPPCQQMKKDVWPREDVQAWVKANAKAIYVDTDQDAKTASTYKISSIPTMIVFKDGKPADRISGGRSASDLLAWLSKNK